MIRYVIRHLLYGFLIMVIAAIVIFVMLRLAPGDPTTAMAGSPAALRQGALAELRHSLGLDRPVLVQMGSYFKDIVTGNWGSSLLSGQSISTIIQEYAGNTLLLAFAAGVITF